jgi:hypothetical protein|tara:strand:+ start:45 stop:266 length:222 start_codon:yes stop_codon:yes gene_type:complete
MFIETPPSQQYTWALESVALINAIVADDTGYIEPAACVARNVEHLQIMIAKDFWTTQDMGPLNSAIIAGLNYD